MNPRPSGTVRFRVRGPFPHRRDAGQLKVERSDALRNQLPAPPVKDRAIEAWSWKWARIRCFTMVVMKGWPQSAALFATGGQPILKMDCAKPRMFAGRERPVVQLCSETPLGFTYDVDREHLGRGQVVPADT